MSAALSKIAKGPGGLTVATHEPCSRQLVSQCIMDAVAESVPAGPGVRWPLLEWTKWTNQKK